MDKRISSIVKEWKEEAGVKGIILVNAFAGSRSTLQICTDRPGLMIGLHGNLVYKYEKKIKEMFPCIEKIEFIETDSWYIK